MTDTERQGLVAMSSTSGSPAQLLLSPAKQKGFRFCLFFIFLLFFSFFSFSSQTKNMPDYYCYEYLSRSHCCMYVLSAWYSCYSYIPIMKFCYLAFIILKKRLTLLRVFL